MSAVGPPQGTARPADRRIIPIAGRAPASPPARQASPDGVGSFALWNLGFRPFYLLAAIFAAGGVPLWVLQYVGTTGSSSYLAGPSWHIHEMVFGFTSAVIAGFLMTAVRNWTSRPTPTGAALAGLALLWVAARATALTPYGVAAAALSVAFPLVVAIGIAIPVVKSANRHNYVFIAVLVMLGLADLCFQLAILGAVGVNPLHAARVALDLILFVMTAISGRVVPMFTNNAIPGAGARRTPLVEGASLVSVLALLVADLADAPPAIVGTVAAVAAVAHAARLTLWRPWKTFGVPLVWILHVACGWIAIHLLLRALAAAGIVAEPLATHALTLGGIGGLTLGMMTRTARGHTGRPLAADGFEIAMFVLVQLAALARVSGPLVAPAAYVPCVVAASVFWSAAFALYAIRYWPVLTRARIDGKPG
jgi:uncharacterized protein involved in response to NO